MTQTYIIEKMNPDDWEQVKQIYLEGIQTGHATFQQSPPSWDEWDESYLTDSRFVARKDNKILGWAALSPVSSRCVYAGVAEISVYVSPRFQGMGVGSSLMETLITSSENQGIWTLQAGIFPENMASIALHKKWGFREVGVREKIGHMNGVWRDVVFLEKRSKKIGQ